MAGAIRGDGLLGLDRALTALAEEPQRLERARVRFSDSPPPYRSHQSHNPTRSGSSNPPDEEQQHREEWKWKLKEEHGASYPNAQFRAQKLEERLRIEEATLTRLRPVPDMNDFYELASENAKEQWIEQGIWNDKWEGWNMWRWKHEEPLETDSEPEADPAVEHSNTVFEVSHTGTKGKERMIELERRPLIERKREHEASRPFHQFIYQISQERKWIQHVINCPKPFVISESDHNTYRVIQALDKRRWPHNKSRDQTDIPDPPDINTMAYETVKGTWTKSGIWNRKWGVLPGMSWKHEQPLEDFLREEMGDAYTETQFDRLDYARERAEKARRRSTVGFSPATITDHKARLVPTPFQRRPFGGPDLSMLEKQ